MVISVTPAGARASIAALVTAARAPTAPETIPCLLQIHAAVAEMD
jgi:hypothetical protein